MKDFSGKLAVITGGGTGMGRALCRQLIAEGCHVATCDIIAENLSRTAEICAEEAPQGVRMTTHICDVADEAAVSRFQREVADRHPFEHINLLFNNAGIGGGGSFVNATREEWDRVFSICWDGVYLMCRAFLPMLLASREGHVINTSSVNGFRASLGGNIPHTAYSAAKFAVKGFTEALINDFRFNAPHLNASVVMPGYVGSEIAVNTGRILNQPSPDEIDDAEVERYRDSWRSGQVTQPHEGYEAMTADEIRAHLQARRSNYSQGGLTPDQAASIILDGVRSNTCRTRCRCLG